MNSEYANQINISMQYLIFILSSEKLSVFSPKKLNRTIHEFTKITYLELGFPIVKNEFPLINESLFLKNWSADFIHFFKLDWTPNEVSKALCVLEC